MEGWKDRRLGQDRQVKDRFKKKKKSKGDGRYI
jgi:hypothetical protein